MTAMDQIIIPTRERLRHANDNFVVTGVAIRMHDAPLDRLYRAGEITPQQHLAGQTYYQDWYSAGMAPLGAVDYSRVLVDGSKPGGVSDFRMAALERFKRSASVLGDDRTVVNSIVLHEQGLFVAGRAAGATTRTATAVARERLSRGLGALAVRYGLLKQNAHIPSEYAKTC